MTFWILHSTGINGTMVHIHTQHVSNEANVEKKNGLMLVFKMECMTFLTPIENIWVKWSPVIDVDIGM